MKNIFLKNIFMKNKPVSYIFSYIRLMNAKYFLENIFSVWLTNEKNNF